MATEALIALWMNRNNSAITNVKKDGTEDPCSLLIESGKIRLWVGRHSQTRKTSMNKQDTYITVCKILNT